MTTIAPKKTDAADTAHSLPVWDIWIRLFHWSLVVAVSFQFLSGLTGWQFVDWHRQAGEFVLALVLFRLLWGVFGSSNVRLNSLVRRPTEAMEHLRALWRRCVPPERGHNAAGSWAVVFLLLLLSIQAVTGMFIADEDELIEGAWYGLAGADLSERLWRLHRLNAEFLEVLVIVHVAMIALYRWWAHRDLLRPMIMGRMHWPDGETPPGIVLQRVWIGALLALLVLLVTGYVSGWFG